MREVRLLGSLEAWVDGTRVDVRRNKQRAALALLALRLGEAISADVLIDELWNERPPPTARDALQNTISQLRRLLGRDAIETRTAGYVLSRDACRTDVDRFCALCDEAREATDPHARAALLRDALSLWRGPALGDVAYHGTLALEAARLDELHAVAEEDSIDVELELGRDAELVPRLESLVERRPYDERARAQLMLALYRAGRQAEALELFRDLRDVLSDELGLEPSPAVRELERAILLQEPSLVESRTEAADDPQRRKTVSVLTVELIAEAALDPERLQSQLVGAIAAARTVAERHGGRVSMRASDELVAVFGAPVTHEDDALRAARTAVEIRDGVTPMRARIGLETGPAVTGHGFVTGDVTRAATHLQRAAAPGEILVGGAALQLVRHAVRGRRTRRAFLLEAVDPEAPAVASFSKGPFVGRQRELSGLVARFESVRAGGRPCLVVLVGEPGVGKSRLAGELATMLAPSAVVLHGRCLSYGEGSAYQPLRDIVSAVKPDEVLAGDANGSYIALRAAQLVGLADGTVPTEEGLWAVRRLISALARKQPLVLVLDDVHWANEQLLDFADRLIRQGTDPLLVLVVGRPELLDRREPWREVAMSLSPLEESDIEELVLALGGDLEPTEQKRLTELADGNPLFAEQLLAYAGERGAQALAAVPPSLEALLAGRLDLLEPSARDTAQRAAVVGREFSRSAVAALADRSGQATLSADLLTLVRHGHVYPARAAAGDERFRFRHALIRDVAYASLPKGERAELHESYGDWLTEQPGGTDEVVGFHLEQGHRYRIELGLADRRARQLAVDAGERLGKAGLRSWRRADLPTTLDLLGRATALLPDRDDRRRELLCELGVARYAVGDVRGAEEAIELALAAATAAKDSRVAVRAEFERAQIRLQLDPEGMAPELLRSASRAVPVLEVAGDHRGLGRAWLLIGFVEGGHFCRNKAWEEAAERALAHYRRAGWPAATPLGQLSAALYYGPAPAGPAVARCDDLLRDTTAGRSGRAQVLRYQAGLVAMTGDFDAARRASDEARAVFDELGQAASAMHCGAVRGDIELLAGDPAAARSQFEALCRFCEEREELALLSTYATDLAEALYELGELGEAERWTSLSESHAASDDIGARFASQAMWAKLLARRGEVGEAEVLARRATALASQTDTLNKRAAVLLALAEVLRSAGKPDEARDVAAEALGLYELKGNAAAAERARLFTGSPTA